MCRAPTPGGRGSRSSSSWCAEPSNKYDKNAVAVHIEGAIVGHIDRAEAPLVGAMLRKLGGAGGQRCRGTIRGGADYPFGVAIDGIPDAYEFEEASRGG
jgi:hypothetical protein